MRLTVPPNPPASKNTFLCLALLFSVFFSPSPSVTASLTVAASPEEGGIQKDLERAFGDRGRKAYILKGSLLYLYRPYRSKYLNINSLGFRGGKVRRKKKGAFHIAVLGGSTVFGVRQADFHTIPYLLEDRLRKMYPDRAVQVFNLGIEGYTIQRETALIKHLFDALEPDLVIFYGGWNDISMAHSINYKDLAFFNEEDETFFIKKQEVSFIQQAIVRTAARIWQRMAGMSWWMRPQTSPGHRKDMFVRQYREYLFEAAAYLREMSVPVLFAIQPAPATRKNLAAGEAQIAAAYEREYPDFLEFNRKCIADLMASDPFRDGTLMDISGAFDETEGEIFTDQIHVNVKGNRIIADRLADIIAARGFIKAHAR